jgi:hypothetical protein
LYTGREIQMIKHPVNKTMGVHRSRSNYILALLFSAVKFEANGTSRHDLEENV